MKKIYLPILLLTLAVSSCDTFDKVPSSEWPSEGAIKTLEDLQFSVNGVYESQTSSIDAGTNPRGSYAGDFFLYADQRGSDFKAIGSNKQTVDVYAYQATKNSSDSYYFYKRFYLSLARINKVLEGVKKSGLEGAEVDVQVGELYALRALFHFDLARLFAKLPCNAQASDPGIVLSTEVFESGYTAERATIAKTYETILDDLKTALDNLPETSKVVTAGHIDYWGARALRARAYLYMNENSKALEDAKYVIEKSPYKLYTRDEYETVWTKVGSSESIFEFLITSLYNAQRNSLGFYTHAEGYAEAGITEGFKTFLQERPEDVRSTLIAEESDGGDNEGWYIQKYPGRDGEIYVNNPKVIRLSEVYLIAAEAALKAGGADPASYINDLRKQRIAGYEDVASVTIDDILTERRLELYGEGHNAWDTWRNKKAVTNAQVPAGPINYDDYRTVMPIPVSEINVSNGKLKQNEGY